MNITERLESAIKQYRAGNVAKAEEICRKILAQKTTHVRSLLLLGLIHSEKNDYNSSIRYIKKALQIEPENADAYFMLGNAYAFQGSVFLDEARDCYQKALQINPNHAASYDNLGNVFQQKGKIDDAIDCFQKALQLDQNRDDTLYNLGNALQKKGLLDEAITCYEKSLRLNPNDSEVFYNLGIAFTEKGLLNKAIGCYQNAVQLTPDYADAHFNLGYALMRQGHLQKAVEHYHVLLKLNPDSSKALLYLGNCFADQGKLMEAERCYRQAMQKNPDDWLVHEVLINTMNYNARHEPQDILSEHVKFAKRFEQSMQTAIFPHSNERSANRKLKIGYVSPDFRKQSVGFFIAPILSLHNHNDFEIFCYYNLPAHDEMTERMQRYADRWRNIAEMSDEEVTELIRNDAIDILVDLAGHTGYNRILVFARKPAPIQVSWIGYPNTTGLSTVDYKIVDNFTDPPGMTDEFYTEKLIRMPESFLCYLPDKDSPEVGQLPALTNGYITFGSFNFLAKLTPEVIRQWGKIIKELPDSRLIMKSGSLFDSSTCQYIKEQFLKHGITENRIELLSLKPTFKEHLSMYNRIDIGLDTFPYNGTTTTYEALWMGVPVVTLEGNSHVSRVGVSILSNIQLKELIANTNEEYAKVAINIANDLQRLKSLRESLREMMKQSPLCDTKRFTENLEMCYRQMWEKWCKSV